QLDNRYLSVYNVKSYGALGNNSNDDTAAVQATINTASTAGGGIVYFPPGTYLVSTSIAPASNVTLLGTGVTSVIAVLPSSNYTGHGIYGFAALNDFTVDSMTFVGSVT